MRFLLLQHMRKFSPGCDYKTELLIYRLCGIVLLILNLTFAVISGYIISAQKSFSYHYIVTIAMATYTFFIFSKSVADMIKYKKLNSPVASASKQINFAVSLVSMLSLETAMLSAFSNGDKDFYTNITFYTSVGVSLCILSLSAYMIISSTKKLKRI